VQRGGSLVYATPFNLTNVGPTARPAFAEKSIVIIRIIPGSHVREKKTMQRVFAVLCSKTPVIALTLGGLYGDDGPYTAVKRGQVSAPERS